MAQNRNEERRYQEAIALGQENLALVPRIERWCNHLSVRQTSGGLLGQMTNLPIGTMAIECPHANGASMQSMSLRDVAVYFVTNNCRDCPKHQELNSNNLGREILREADKVVDEERADAVKLSASATKLHTMVRGDLSVALKTAPTTEQSVLECVARLDDPMQAVDAAKLLVQAAELAPEFFNDLACEVLAEHFTDARCAAGCAEAMQTLGSKRGAIPTAALKAARRCVDQVHCDDAVLDLLADDWSAGGELPSVPSVARIVRHHGYRQTGSPIYQPPEANPGQTRALLTVGRRDPERLVLALNRILEEPDPHVRIAAAVAISALLDELPAMGPMLLSKLTRSLNLDDSEMSEPSADAHACGALAHIFTYYPTETRAALESAAAFATPEVQKLLVKPYECLVRDDFKDLPAGPARDRLQKALVASMDALLPFVTDSTRPLEAREKAAETIRFYGWDHPDVVLDRLDSIIGALALVIAENLDFKAKNPGGDPILKGFPRSEHMEYEHIARLLRDAIDRVIGKDFPRVFEAVSGMLGRLSSAVPAEELLKYHLLELLEKLARDHEVGPRVVPLLYVALMDVQSVLVRGRALQIIADILPRHEELVPDNMREMAVIYLRDSYVMLHQEAAKVMGYFKPASYEQAQEILGYLVGQYVHYAKEKTVDHRHLREVTRSVVRVGRHYPEFFPKLVLPLLTKQVRSEDKDATRDALEEMKKPARQAPALERIYVEHLLGYFRRFIRGRDRSDEYSPDRALYRSLYDSGRAAIAANEAEFDALVRALAKDAGWEALQFIPVLLHHECYEAAARCAELIAVAQPSGQRQEWVREQALLMVAAAKAEAAIRLGDSTAALATLRGEESRLKFFDPKPNADDPKAFINAFSMAHKVSRRIK